MVETYFFHLWWSFPVFMTLFTTDKAAKKANFLSFNQDESCVLVLKWQLKVFKNVWWYTVLQEKDGLK